MSDSIDEMASANQNASGNIFLSFDADNAGQMVGRAVLANDEQALGDVSNRIDHGQEVISQWVSSVGGRRISGGGDEFTAAVPAEALEQLEQLRSDYQYATQFTVTVGAGSSLSESGKALMAGKFRGKDQVVQYDPSVDQELASAQEHVAAGSGTEEENKISEAYLSKDDHEHTDNCQYCLESEGKLADHDHTDDCQYCAESAAAEMDHDHTDDCQYCAESAAAEMDHDHTDNCEYCAEAEMADHDHTDDCQYCKEKETTDHEHTGDDCQYCKEKSPQGEGNEETSQASQNVGKEPIQGQESGSEETVQGQEGLPEGTKEIVQTLETDDPNTQEEANEMNQIDATDLAIGHEMQDNISRPDGYNDDNTPADMGLAEDEDQQSPDLSEVLKDGLDSHSDSISREKVVGMVSEALEGFKACKPILEKAKEQAPQLYEASISMLKAMIEMAKMLGIGQETAEAAPAEEDQGDPAQAQGGNDWHEPFPKHPDQGGDENATIGQSAGKLSAKHTTKHVARTPFPPGAVNGKGQQKVIDPKTGKTRWIDRKQGMVASATGVPVKPPKR